MADDVTRLQGKCLVRSAVLSEESPAPGAGLFFGYVVANHSPKMVLVPSEQRINYGSACMKTANGRGIRGCEWLHAHVIRMIGF